MVTEMVEAIERAAARGENIALPDRIGGGRRASAGEIDCRGIYRRQHRRVAVSHLRG